MQTHAWIFTFNSRFASKADVNYNARHISAQALAVLVSNTTLIG